MSGGETFHVSSKHDTLYDALGVLESAPSGHIRKVADTLRRSNATADRHLHDVCLAQEVLGDPALRTEYDRLIGRLRGAGMPLPKIGVAIEGERLGPALTTRVGVAGRAGLQAAGSFLKALFSIAFVIGVIVLIAIGIGSSGGGSRYGASTYEYKPIQLPDYSKLYIPPPIDYSQFKYTPPNIEIPKFDYSKLEVPTYKAPKARTPKAPKASTLKTVPPPRVVYPPAEAPTSP